jgi:hypothetical protein
MIRITLDKHTLIDLCGCLEELEICDDSEQVMARLTPDPAYRRKMYDQAWAMICEEEIEVARLQRGKGRTLDEILKRPGSAEWHTTRSSGVRSRNNSSPGYG